MIWSAIFMFSSGTTGGNAVIGIAIGMVVVVIVAVIVITVLISIILMSRLKKK